MNARLTFRSLLTTTSMAALLVSAHGARATPLYDNPYGDTIAQIYITSTVPYVSNAGTITNDDGEDGIEIYDTTVNGTVDNSGSISVSDLEGGDDSLRGISIDDTYIWGSIENSGSIAVTASGSGNGESGRYAAGIDFGDGSTLSGDVHNSGSIDVSALVTNVDGESIDDETSRDANADAYGIRFDNTDENQFYAGEISNTGSIDVQAKAKVDQSASDETEDGAYAEGTGNATAYAAGIDARNDGTVGSDHHGPYIASDVSLDSYDEGDDGINVDATAQSFSDVQAQVTCDGSGESCYGEQYAEGVVIDHASAQAYGAKFSGNSAVVGDVYNDATIDVSALAETLSVANADAPWGTARAYAGYRDEEDEYYETSIAQAAATGLDIDVLQVSGDIESYDDIYAHAVANGQSTATATAPGYVEAAASNDALATARGIVVDTLLVSGNFTNGASATGLAEATSTNKATAHSGDDGEAWADSAAEARAAGIDFHADSLGGTFTNENDGYWEDDEYIYDTVKGTALAHAVASAITTGGQYSSASATGYADAEAYGIDADVGAIAGHFVNEGVVEAHTVALGEQKATVSDNESLEARAYGDELGASATGIRLNGETLAGSFYNDGDVSANASATGVSTALATGLDDVLASAANSAYAHAQGISVEEEEVQDSIHNDGAIYAGAKADVTQKATGTANDDGEGDAAALAGNWDDYGDYSVAQAYATGLYIRSGDIGGNVVNSDEIVTDATANLDSVVQATATNNGDAWTLATGYGYAEGYGIRAEIGDLGYGNPVDEDSYYGNGYFVNEGAIDVNVAANFTLSATSLSDDGDAGAGALLPIYYSEDGNALAYGISLDDSEEGADIRGDVLNFAPIDVNATTVAVLDASATVDDGDDTSALAVAGGAVWSGAYGIAIDDIDAEGGFYNEGDIGVTARTTITAYAFADSDDGPAFAMIGSTLPYDGPGFGAQNYAGAFATGVSIDDSDFEDGFWNDSAISAAAYAKAQATGEAHGDEQALVFARNSAGAQSVGVDLSDSWFGEDIVNTGTIAGIATASVETDILADGDIAGAYIDGYDGEAAWASATATGLSVSGYSGATVRNGYNSDEDYMSEDGSGQIWALAGAFGDNQAEANGETAATASASNAEYAEATGYSGQSGSSYAGDFINDGLIAAGALAAGQESADATADTSHSIATASAYDETEAHAVGVEATAYEISNYGQIFAGAGALSDAAATAEGGAARAEAGASANAYATGVSMQSQGEDGGYFYNSGDITALAYARAHASADITYHHEYDESWTDAGASAYAYAEGVSIADGSVLEEFHNDEGGVIHATADADATLGNEDDEIYGEATAYATGLYVGGASVGSIQNDGEISADASGRSLAYARGIHIDGTYEEESGTLTNTGTISAEATSENPYATAILVSDGGLLSSITNSGDISATVEDTSDFDLFGYGGSQTVAIDIRGAGAAIAIHLLKGSVTGDILTDNENADTINWSGGTIDGDITGNESEDGDTLNVFAGEDDDFTYDGTIDGLAFFNINGGEYSDDVALRLTNTVRNVGAFHVGPNGSLTLGTDATVTTGSLDLDAAATLTFELTSEGVNGVINTSSADLGGATVKAVFLDVGLPVSQTYRIINWDGSETQFGSVVSNSLLEKIVAQYGEDGVDLLATRLSFADIEGLKDDATSFGKALDRVFDGIDPDSELGLAIYQLILLTPEEYAAAMNEIAGQQTADVQSVTFSQAGSLIHVIQTQLSELRGGTIASADARSLGIRVASNQVMASMSDAPQPGMGEAGTTLSGDWSAWARVFGDWAELDRSSVAAGFTSTTGGVVAGGDYSFSPNFLAGLAAGYQSSDMKFRGTGKGDISSWSLTAYGDYRMGPAYIDALLGYAKQSYDMDRYLTVLGVDYIANSDYDGSSIIGSVEAGYEIVLGASVKLTPFAGVNFTHTDTDAVTETGAGIWNLAYDSRSENGIDSVLGTRLSKSFVTEGGTKLTPTVELGWKHSFGNASPTANAALAGTPGSNFQIFGSTAERDAAVVGAALSVQMTDTIDAYLQYNGQYSGNYMDNTASLRLRWKF